MLFYGENESYNVEFTQNNDLTFWHRSFTFKF